MEFYFEAVHCPGAHHKAAYAMIHLSKASLGGDEKREVKIDNDI